LAPFSAENLPKKENLPKILEEGLKLAHTSFLVGIVVIFGMVSSINLYLSPQI
jgi:hypothetical protein